MVYQKSLLQIKEFVENYYADNLNPNRLYHNLQHTQEVLGRVLEVAGHYKLDSKSLFIIQAAAWFNDIGYLEDPDNPGKRGSRIAERFLTEIQIDTDIIKSIKSCILSTRLPQTPKNFMEQVVCDANMYYLGLEDFDQRSKLIRKELILVTGRKISKEEWKHRNIELLQNHRFKTDYAKQSLTVQQKKNLDQLLDASESSKELSKDAGNTANKSGSNTAPATNSTITQQKDLTDVSPQKIKPKSSESSAPAKNTNRPDRGIETMFRISSTNHQALSQMADNKAHIMITVNSIIISVLLSVLFRSLDNEPHLAIPVAILLLVNVITIIFSILATRPNIPPGNFTKEDLDNQEVNLLFFGHFYKMQLNDYSEAMIQLMEDRNFLYNSLIKNLYQQGLVLGKKYRFLRVSYNVFMYGLVLSIVAFGIAILIHQL